MKIGLLSMMIIFVWGLAAPGQRGTFKTVSFDSKDGLKITADLYMPHPAEAPFIVLFHQARSSRGEYRTIAPELNAMGFNAMAVDLRSGGTHNGVGNETAERAQAGRLSGNYLDALPDMEAAIEHARADYAKSQLIVWGSSYSASLALLIAGEKRIPVDAVLAFSPGEYFTDLGKAPDFITRSARKVVQPVFITSMPEERGLWTAIYNGIPSKKKVSFLPTTDGVHGASMLLESSNARKEVWTAVKAFLKQFLPQ